MATRSGALELARSNGLLGSNSIDGGVDVSGIQRWVSTFKHEQSVDKRIYFPDINKLVSSQTKMVTDCFDQLKSRFIHPR